MLTWGQMATGTVGAAHREGAVPAGVLLVGGGAAVPGNRGVAAQAAAAPSQPAARPRRTPRHDACRIVREADLIQACMTRIAHLQMKQPPAMKPVALSHKKHDALSHKHIQ